MKIIVTHASPDWDAITSVWLLKRFLPGWNEAEVKFVPAGSRLAGSVKRDGESVIEKIDRDEVIHVDTGLTPLDHHETDDKTISAASRTWEFSKSQNLDLNSPDISDRMKTKMEAVSRMVKLVVDIDHFKEVFWAEPTADYHEFSLLGVLEGLKFQRPDDDMYYLTFGMECLDATLHNFENRIWAEKEIKEHMVEFQSKWGKALGFESLNDTVIKLAQKMGYRLVVRKDPRKGYVRIKARPSPEVQSSKFKVQSEQGIVDIDLTPVYEKLREKDPEATWFLHVSKKMLLNGTTKNPDMKPSKLTLHEIIEVIKSVK